MNNLFGILDVSAGTYDDKPMLVYGEREVWLEEFRERAKRLAAKLAAMGAAPGERVIVLSDNSPEWLISFMAVVYTGAAAVPVNPGLVRAEVAPILEDCQPVLAIVDEKLFDLVAGATCPILQVGSQDFEWHREDAAEIPGLEFQDVDPLDPAIIFYTSGTTGRPKGVVLSHAGMNFDTEMFSKHLGMNSEDRSLIFGSMGFMLHLVLNALSSIRAGVTLYFLPRFRPQDALDNIARNKITLLMAVPTVYTMMLNWLEDGNSADLSSVRWAFSAGAAFPAALYNRAYRVFGIPVFDLWGLTECAPVTSYYPSIDTEGRLGSCGRPLPGCAIAIVDDDLNELPPNETGEVLLKSPAMMTGYFKNEKATAETLHDGWVRSGDLGTIDDDGYLYIVGRKKDMIIRGGSNIYPVEIEQVLYTHPSVAECAVVGMPDDTFGEIVCAFVVLKEGQNISDEAIVEHCKSNLAGYKVPARVNFAEDLPKGPTGKILHRELKLQQARIE